MSDFSQIMATIKRASREAVEASQPFGLTYGTVKTVDPLVITVDQKLELSAKQLLLTTAVRDHDVDMTVDHQTEDETEHVHAVQDTYSGGGSSSPTTHRHNYTGRKTFTVHSGLLAGETVLLLRVQGGQKYIVLDRLEVPDDAAGV